MEENKYEYEVNEQDMKQNKQKPKRRTFLVICAAILIGVTAGATFKIAEIMIQRVVGIRAEQVSLAEGEQELETQTGIATTQLNQASSTIVSDVSQVVENVMPSVVSITNMSVQQVQNFFGNVKEREVESSGSGIIIGENETELLIVTNNHVISENTTLTITFVDEESVEGIVKGSDVNKDLAIVAIPIASIETSTREAIKIAQIGDSKQLRVGEPAIAIGNALGYGQSVTTGVISALGRDIEVQGFDNTLIQTDAAINPGNSGGALLNANGEVIGINTIKMSMEAVEGMGYAIPISDVSDIITALMNRETKEKVPEAQRGYIGIQGVDVTADNAKLYAMPQGVYISEVIAGSGAAIAEVRKGDILTGIQGINIQNMQGLQEQLSYYEAGEMIQLELQRTNEEQEYERHIVEVTLTNQNE
jgi:Trypsin-like serine proteases, typically periplasmic, contain C-terminal PDZ domain